jgi:SSS family solute:Na+ symporter
MYMHAVAPGTTPILVLPTYLLQYEPVWLGGIAMGGIMLSLIGSIAGLSLGIGTMVSHDILSGLLRMTGRRLAAPLEPVCRGYRRADSWRR